MSILGMISKLIGATLLLGFAVQVFDEMLLPPFNHLTLVYQDAFNVINSTEVKASDKAYVLPLVRLSCHGRHVVNTMCYLVFIANYAKRLIAATIGVPTKSDWTSSITPNALRSRWRSFFFNSVRHFE